MPALNFLPLPRVSHPKPPAQTDGLPTLPGPWLLVPYVKLELPSPVGALSGHLPLRAINFGPGPEPTLKLRGVKSLLAGYPHYAKVPVEGSAAPLRV